MKLYTEEQVKRAIDIADDNPYLFDYYDILSKLTPIELPSENEIEESSPYRIGSGNYIPLANFHRWEGAKWVIEQIKQQDNDKI